MKGPLPENVLRYMAKKDRAQLGKAGRTWNEVEKAIEAKSERVLQKQIGALLNQRDIWQNRSRMDKRATNKRGTPDFLFAWKDPRSGIPRPYAFEVKIGKAEPSTDQLDCHAHMRRNGWLVFVVRSLVQAQELLRVAA